MCIDSVGSADFVGTAANVRGGYRLRAPRHARGFTLIEMIVFIIIVSVALAVLNVTTKNSADPLLRKQMLTIAEALLDEVQMRPFTYCDPNDANAATAASPADCTVAAAQQIFGHKATTNRATYDNVGNYCAETGTNNAACSDVTLGTAGSDASQIPDLTGVGTFSPPGYWATISLAPQALGAITSTNTAAGLNVIQITVTVASAKTSETITLQGYRTRWAPNP